MQKQDKLECLSIFFSFSLTKKDKQEQLYFYFLTDRDADKLEHFSMKEFTFSLTEMQDKLERLPTIFFLFKERLVMSVSLIM